MSRRCMPIVVLAEAHLQAEGVETRAALDHHIHIDERRDAVGRRRVVLAPGTADLDDPDRPAAGGPHRHVGGPRHLENLLEIEIELVEGIQAADDAPAMHDLGVAGHDLRDELIGQLAHLLEADAGAKQPIRQMVVGEVQQRSGGNHHFSSAQRRHASVDRGEIEMPLPRLDAGPVDRQRHRGKELQRPVQVLGLGNQVRVDATAQTAPAETVTFPPLVEDRLALADRQFLRVDRRLAQRVIGQLRGRRGILDALNRLDEQILGLLGDLLHAFETVEERPVLAPIRDLHQLGAGQLDVEDIGPVPLGQAGGRQEDSAETLDRPEQRQTGGLQSSAGCSRRSRLRT